MKDIKWPLEVICPIHPKFGAPKPKAGGCCCWEAHVANEMRKDCIGAWREAQEELAECIVGGHNPACIQCPHCSQWIDRRKYVNFQPQPAAEVSREEVFDFIIQWQRQNLIILDKEAEETLKRFCNDLVSQFQITKRR